MVRHFRKRFGGGDADRDRNAGPLQHALPQFARMRLEAVLETAKAEKRLVDRIELELGRELFQHAHHARAHVAVKCVIARTHAQHAGIDALPHDMPRFAHGDAERLGFVGTRDHAPIVVGQHY